MRMRKFLSGVAALTLVVAPTVASAANPAARLSVSSSVRASSPAGKSQLGGGGGLWAVLALAAVIVGAIIIGEGGDHPHSP